MAEKEMWRISKVHIGWQWWKLCLKYPFLKNNFLSVSVLSS
jgi:hypothetical protein